MDDEEKQADDDNQYDMMCEQSFDNLESRIKSLKDKMMVDGGFYYAEHEDRILKDMYYIVKGMVRKHNLKLKESGAGHRVGCGGIIFPAHPDYDKEESMK